MKKYYFAVMVDNADCRDFSATETIEEKHRYLAFVVPVSENANFVHTFKSIGGIVAANIMPSKKEAQKCVDFWNETFKSNGTYAY